MTQHNPIPPSLAEACKTVRRSLADGIARRYEPSQSEPDTDGRWGDIDYKDQMRSRWLTREHLLRTRGLAVAAHYGSAEAHHAALVALDHWIEADYRNPNWWHNDIGTPMLVGETLILLNSPDRSDRAEKLLAPGADGAINSCGSLAAAWWKILST